MTGAGRAELIGAVHDDVAGHGTLVESRHDLGAELRALDSDVAIPAEQSAEREHRHEDQSKPVSSEPGDARCCREQQERDVHRRVP